MVRLADRSAKATSKATSTATSTVTSRACRRPCCRWYGATSMLTPMNYMLIMRNEQSGLVAIGPVSIEYQAAMLRDEIEESSNWTTVGIARVMNEEQARTAVGASKA